MTVTKAYAVTVGRRGGGVPDILAVFSNENAALLYVATQVIEGARIVPRKVALINGAYWFVSSRPVEIIHGEGEESIVSITLAVKQAKTRYKAKSIVSRLNKATLVSIASHNSIEIPKGTVKADIVKLIVSHLQP